MSQNNAEYRTNTAADEILRSAQDDNSPSPLADSSSPSSSALAPSPWLLRRADQGVLALLVLSALGAMALWLLTQRGLGQQLIEVDQVQPAEVHYQVDINAACLPELLQLPGVGQKLSQRIIELRQSEGPFSKADDLLRVRGIGPIIMHNLRPYLLPLPEDKMIKEEVAK